MYIKYSTRMMKMISNSTLTLIIEGWTVIF